MSFSKAISYFGSLVYFGYSLWLLQEILFLSSSVTCANLPVLLLILLFFVVMKVALLYCKNNLKKKRMKKIQEV